MKRFVVCLAALWSALTLPAFGQQKGTVVTILVDYTVAGRTPGLKGEHGYCVLIEKDGRQFLYDTGRTDLAVRNAALLGKDLARTEKIFLSHGHIDHTGGIEHMLKAIGHPVEIIAHSCVFDRKYGFIKNGTSIDIGMPFTQKYLAKKYKATFNIQDGPYEVAPGLWLTGEVPIANGDEKMAKISYEVEGNTSKVDLVRDDNTVVIDTAKGLVVVFGCGHRGVINTLAYIKKTFHKDIYAVMGGLHLDDADAVHLAFVRKSLQDIFTKEKTGMFAPCHCTGANVINAFGKEFVSIFIRAGAGSVFNFD